MVEAIDEKELAIKVKYFQPDFFKWVIIGNDQYDTISAAHEAFKGFKDLPPVLRLFLRALYPHFSWLKFLLYQRVKELKVT